MTQFLSPERLARMATNHPWIVLGAWVALLFGAMVSAASIGGVLTSEAETYRASDSSRAEDLMIERIYGTEPVNETVVVHADFATTNDPAFQAVATEIVAGLRALPGLEVTNYYETPAPALVSESGRSLLIPVAVTEGDAEDKAADIVEVLELFDGKAGFTVVTGGAGSVIGSQCPGPSASRR